MIIETQINDRGEWTLVLSGKIDVTTVEELREAIASVPTDAAGLTLDFRDVTYIGSAGLREMLVCRKRFPDKRLRVRNVVSAVMDVFKMTGFNIMLPVEEADSFVSTYVNLSIQEMLNWHVRKSGNRVALKTERETYTWEEIDRAAQIIAGDLNRLGVGVGSHVGICGGNSVNWVLAFYATQKLGAIAMLINPVQSAREIGRICSIGDITCLCYGEIPGMKDEAKFLEEVRAASGGIIARNYSIRSSVCFRVRFSEYEELKGRFEQKVEADAPCVVIFTSGSTGRPKGVILSAYNLLNAAKVQVKLQRMTSRDKNLLIVPLFHILGLVVCLLPCAMTNALLYIPDDIRTDTLIRIMSSEKCTLLHSVPTMIIALINNKDFSSGAFQSLRCTYLAGAAATEAQLKLFREKMPNNHFMIAYGLSEMAPVSVTLYDDDEDRILHTVGRPVENISIKIIDRASGTECPAGQSGEILVQGFNLMTGYYKLSLEDQAIDDEGWLHTGDMGYIDSQGYLCLSGRFKELIIRGGENIMPQEVEAAISELDIIDNVKVIGVPSDFFGEEVAACVMLKDGAVFDEAAVRAELAKRLARYKMPSYFIVYEQLPLLGSGKIDGAALKEDVLQKITAMKR